MKHKKTLTFSIFLLPLLLTSCGNPTSSTLSSPTSIQPGSTVNTTPTSKQTDTGVKATTSSTPDEPEDDPDIIKPEDSPWSEEVTKAMVKYLGGNILLISILEKISTLNGMRMTPKTTIDRVSY